MPQLPPLTRYFRQIPVHSVMQFLADPLDRRFDELLARLEVLVGRTTIDSGATRDLGDTQPFLAVLRSVAEAAQRRSMTSIGPLHAEVQIRN